MNLIERAKNILISPKSEWAKVATESDSHSTVLKSYVLPLALIGPVCAFIGQSLIGPQSIVYGIVWAVISLLFAIIGLYLIAGVFYMLAPSFSATHNFDKAFQLVAYAYTPTFIAGIFNLLPALSIIGTILGLYSLVLIFLGLKPVLNVADDKKIVYFIVGLLAYLVVAVLLGMLVGTIVGLFSFATMAAVM